MVYFNIISLQILIHTSLRPRSPRNTGLLFCFVLLPASRRAHGAADCVSGGQCLISQTLLSRLPVCSGDHWIRCDIGEGRRG